MDDAPADPALAALAAARGITRGRPARRRERHRADQPGTGQHRGGYSGPGPDPGDPQRLGEVLAAYVGDRGWERPLSSARVFSDWTRIVGPDVAAHCAPTGLRDGELTVRAQSSAWATQLRLLSATLLARLVAELGPDVVHKLVITGPTGPSWKHGVFSVRGARGPRDTYG